MQKLYTYMKPYKKQLIAGPIFKLAEAVLELAVPLVMAEIIDTGLKNGDTGYVIKMGILLGVLAAVGLACSAICQKSASIASQGTGTNLRDAVFEHIMKISHKEIDKFGAPTLVTRITNDINQVQLLVAMIIRLAIRAPFITLGSIVTATIISPSSAPIFVITALLISIAVFLIMKTSLPYYSKTAKNLDFISKLTRENLTGARVIRAFSGQKRQREKFEQANDEYNKTALTVNRLSSLTSPITSLVVNVAIAGVILIGADKINTGSLSQGELIALVGYMQSMLTALLVVANLVIIFTKSIASWKRVAEVLDAQPSITNDANAIISNIYNLDNSAVEFEHVTFGYDESDKTDNALEDINLMVKTGQTVGIIGATGSGKSTLASLIMRFYDVSRGSIKIFGNDIRKIDTGALRKLVSIVPQSAMLLSGTVRDNLLWGNSSATDEDLWKALDIAQATEFVSNKPDKLDYYISEGAKNLSGGQKQRLTIARALVSKPKILILDDSSSALDYATDSALRKSLAEFMPESSKIIISQRVVSVMNSDVIYVIDEGRIAGYGTHENLLVSCDIYREICESQRISANS